MAVHKVEVACRAADSRPAAAAQPMRNPTGAARVLRGRVNGETSHEAN